MIKTALSCGQQGQFNQDSLISAPMTSLPSASRAGISGDAQQIISDDTYGFYEGDRALYFLLSVACGLENLSRLGEPEIFTTFRTAWLKYEQRHPGYAEKIAAEMSYVLKKTSEIRKTSLNGVRRLSPYSVIKDLFSYKMSDELSIIINLGQPPDECLKVIAGIFSSIKRSCKVNLVLDLEKNQEKDVNVFLDAVIKFQKKRETILDVKLLSDFFLNPTPFVITFLDDIRIESEKILYLGKSPIHNLSVPESSIVYFMDDLMKKMRELDEVNKCLLDNARQKLGAAVGEFYSLNQFFKNTTRQ
jgi:hypothetical protein